MTNGLDKLVTAEHCRAVWLGLGMVLLAFAADAASAPIGFVTGLLCVAQSTRLADRQGVVLRHYRAVAVDVGVAVSLPLGTFLSTVVFSGFPPSNPSIDVRRRS